MEWWCQVSASLSGHCGSLYVQSWGGASALGEAKGTSLRGLPPTADLCQHAVFRKQGCWAQGWLCGLFWAVDPMRRGSALVSFWRSRVSPDSCGWWFPGRWCGACSGEKQLFRCGGSSVIPAWSPGGQDFNSTDFLGKMQNPVTCLCMHFYWKAYSYTAVFSGTVNIVFPIRWDC